MVSLYFGLCVFFLGELKTHYTRTNYIPSIAHLWFLLLDPIWIIIKSTKTIIDIEQSRFHKVVLLLGKKNDLQKIYSDTLVDIMSKMWLFFDERALEKGQFFFIFSKLFAVFDDFSKWRVPNELQNSEISSKLQGKWRKSCNFDCYFNGRFWNQKCSY